MKTIADALRQKSRQFANKEAVVYANVRLTFDKLNQRVNRLSHALASMGNLSGERIAVLSENCHQYLETYFAAFNLGASIVPLNFIFSDNELVRILSDSETICCLVGDGYEECAERIKSNLPAVSNWITLSKPRDGFLFYEDLLQSALETDIQFNVDENQMVILAYAKCNKKSPKGVMLSHHNIINAVSSITAQMNLRSTDVGCYALPFYQTDEVILAFCMLLAGGKVVINRNPDASEILRLIQDERCTHINLVPDLFNWLQRSSDFDRYNLSSLKLMTYYGATFNRDNLLECIKKFWKPFAKSYGSTETVGCSITVLEPSDHILEGPDSNRLYSAGRPLSGVEVKIVDPQRNKMNFGEIGEVVVKSDNVMLGYWKQPELTRQVLKNGWFYTGDIGYIDKSGYLYVLGQKNENLSVYHHDGLEMYPMMISSKSYPIKKQYPVNNYAN